MSTRALHLEPCAFAGFPLNPADHLRTDDKWIGERLEDPDTLFLVFHQMKPLMDVSDRNKPVPGFLDRSQVPDAALKTAVFMGLLEETAVFAVELGDTISEQEASGETAKFIDLRSVALQMVYEEFSPLPALMGKAKSLLDWHARHGFCAVCGAGTEAGQAGYLRQCPSCKAQHFPRTDPVAIMLVHRGDQMLVGRGVGWPAGNFSALAGFIEPGETIEEGCRREVREEVGIEIGQVDYIKSQPWPFPSSLMIGLYAEALTEDIRIDDKELEEARWVNRAQAKLLLLTGGTDDLRLAPYPIAIARHLIEKWVAEGD
ncbi:NAD(+) diphosphatase [Emcibacter nanhaiensis]|uniref:NAD(+) diphosphatase n=1 Tax=Emcibacter nanhaiensis TaxID=1505037 RepID=A0A501PCU5_9PROT|nr:NAD(+) diphosphatase [Emcibacter nanhaiensis]TPD57827.1 NAD(+) diphosphatase [Emcibacter nanhaiensis]